MSPHHHDDSGSDEENNLLGAGSIGSRSGIISPRPSLADPDGSGEKKVKGSINDYGYSPTSIHSQIYSSSSTSSASSSSLNSPSSRPTRTNHFTFAALALYWFGWSFLWLPLLIVIIPYQVLSLAPHSSKGSALGSTLLFGSVVSLVCAPLFGSWSDTSKMKMGRRRPYMLCGLGICSFALVMMAFSPTLGWFSTSFLLLSIGNNMILAPYSALFPDIVPMEHRGTASGYLGFMSMLGYLFGGACSYFLENVGQGACYAILGTVHAICMGVTCYFIVETPLDPNDDTIQFLTNGWKARLASFLAPFQSHDFRILFFTRFLMQMGILTVQEYLQYYLQDAITVFSIGGAVLAESPQKAVSILFLPVLIGAIISSLSAGMLSDMLGGKRKVIVYASGAVMACACVLFGLTRDFGLDLMLGLIFGCGFGAFSTMDWAMATDVLPHPHERAKDMGIWSLALVLPQVLATPIAGYLLDYFQDLYPGHSLGYTVVFGLATVEIGIGIYFVKFLENVD